MNVFAGARYNSSPDGFLNADANFDSFPIAFITLFRSSTGENYNGIMHDLARKAPYCVPDGEDANCGDGVAAAILFVVFFSLTDFLMIKLLIAVILDAFLSSGDGEDVPSNTGANYRLTEETVKAYARLWGQFDKKGTGYIDYGALRTLTCKLAHPLGLAGSPHLTVDQAADTAAMHRRADKLLARLPVVPTVAGKFNYHAILHALVSNASGGTALGAAQGTVSLSGVVATRGYTLQEIRAAVLIQAVFRAKHARKRVLKRLGDARAGGSTQASAETSRRTLPVPAGVPVAVVVASPSSPAGEGGVGQMVAIAPQAAIASRAVTAAPLPPRMLPAPPPPPPPPSFQALQPPAPRPAP
jgi:hypothetical protein